MPFVSISYKSGWSCQLAQTILTGNIHFASGKWTILAGLFWGAQPVLLAITAQHYNSHRNVLLGQIAVHITGLGLK